MATLVFPALNQSALDFLDAARRRGEAVVGAASVHDAQMADAFGEFIVLPYVYDERFRGEFLELIRAREIAHVYAPVASVHAFLEGFLERERLPVALVGSSPIRDQVEAYRRLRGRAAAARAFVQQCAQPACDPPSQLEIAAVLRQASLIYGESNDEKIAAMLAVLGTAPRGDVVEIGSLMGRSLFVLAYLARRYGIGRVLSVDPLSAATSFQHDMPEGVQTAMDDQWDYEILREAFAVNVLPFGHGELNYLRMSSADGFARYRKSRTVRSAELGETTYAGTIAVLHVDGNHDYAHVNEDCELWVSLLAPGAWLILDDYLWAHGDGPFRVGNALLDERAASIERAFTCGKALFVNFR